MIVKQRYAGWTGVIIGDVCTNGSIQFDVAMFGRGQLPDYIPTLDELDRLIQNVKLNQPKLVHHIKYLEEVLDEMLKKGHQKGFYKGNKGSSKSSYSNNRGSGHGSTIGDVARKVRV